MARMMNDSRFANCVRTLKVRMCDLRLGGPVGVLDFETSCLTAAIHCLKRLKTLDIYGSSLLMEGFIAGLPQAVPWLEGLTVRYYKDGSEFIPIPTPWTCLRQLSIHPMTPDISVYAEAFQHLGLSLRRLRIANQSNLLPIIGSLTQNLTHLELASFWGVGSRESLLDAILSNGSSLESLRIGGVLFMHEQSVFFRKYPRSLPHLRDFSARFTLSQFSMNDPDLFPAICDFLRERPLLESLELVLGCGGVLQATLGFDERVWEGLTSMQHLHTLCLTVPTAKPPGNIVQWIPRSVKTLTLRIWRWHSNFLHGLLLQGGWPDDLLFFWVP